MTDDRTLLKKAAKAAGLKIRHWYEPGWADIGPADDWWNPLKDDGDAFRLAVALGMTIDIGTRPVAFTEASVIQDDTRIGAEEYHDEDPYAATRRAIVRAAAALAKEST